jgi:dUTP pyrophosphatase
MTMATAKSAPQANDNSSLIPIKVLDHAKDLPLPAYATAQSAGMDLLAAIDAPMTLGAGDYAMVPTGISIALPSGYECQVRPRSGLAAKNGVTVLNAPGTVDADYRGEIKAILINHSKVPFTIERGMRIAQMVIAKYEHITWEPCDNLEETSRGAGGFGSTGTK